MIPGGDPNLATYLNEQIETGKVEQQNNTFWFPTPEKSGKTEDYAPIQTPILNYLNETKNNNKMNLTDNAESREQILERIGWTDTLLTKIERHAVEKKS